MSKNSSWELAEGMGERYLGYISKDVDLWNRNKEFAGELERFSNGMNMNAASVAQVSIHSSVDEMIKQGTLGLIDETARTMQPIQVDSIVTDALRTEASQRMAILAGDGSEFVLGKFKATVWVHEPGVVAVTRYGDPYHGFLRWTKRREVEPGEVFEARGHQFISRPEVGGRLHLARNFGETVLSRLVNPETGEPNVALNIYQKI